MREDYWGGDLGVGEKKAVRQQLFKGNEYWFWMGTEVEQAKISVHVYDADGKLAEQPDSWQKGHFAAAHVIPKTTGSYFVIVRWTARQKNGRTGRWFTDSGRFCARICASRAALVSQTLEGVIVSGANSHERRGDLCSRSPSLRSG